MEMAICVMEEQDGPVQGTALAVEGLELVAADRVLTPQMLTDCRAIFVAIVIATETWIPEIRRIEAS